ncbi:MAG: tellurite resistance/C4-dicarboxylate transporter family protein [Mycobacterium pseudokansasii]|uniref:tellurite resistance/C4-dicarboxylate transporter family protein n=1 Tax=Mycobacterium pseudokansasii TaxID=2341080 RepID=UPI0007B4F896|nr:tellurite resistance/C4-dicarboxylate transporter family protein [Mycobacterium pseudokansasii]KZS59677.1 C4-dicarboxylate ABC transporter [Mycobacterium kansasii]MBY0387798.1 tellurite resistance/C4-dicarboxylate transporter family protein [Mycobacterium pseudokansasii]VBA31842.1 putative membrane protein [Mycobacterium pseudokansasii]VBA33643.1 putative membrane protein [Mycobacterium pseudokansasii]
MTLRLADAEPSPDVFAAVMATGIVSIAAEKHHYRLISETMGVLASLGLVFLIALVILTRRFRVWDLRDPDLTLRLFTFVAACAVLDSRLMANVAVVLTLGVAASSSWLVLVVLAARNITARPWTRLRDRAHGAWELASVGTSGLAIVAAKVARSTGEPGWLGIAVPIWVVALGIYGLMTWLIVCRAVAERRDRDNFEPDSWILMGGLAIATLAGDNIHRVAPAWLARPVCIVTVVTWVAATLWIPPLVYFGLRRISQGPEALRFAGVWWAFVFPLGMYSVATEAMAAELGRRSLSTVSLVFCWIAVTAWVIVAVAGLLRLRRAVASNRD